MKKYLITVMLFICFLLSVSLVSAPPVPKNVRGTIFHNDGSYATGGIYLHINETVTNYSVYTRTNGYGPPFIDAAYVSTIQGNANDLTIVTAWNSTHYGTNSTLLPASSTAYINVILNTTRPSEANLTLTHPVNNSLFNISNIFTVNATVSIVGSAGTSCSATISFSDTDVLKLYFDSPTHNLGDIPIGTQASTYWNLTGNQTGNSKLTVTASCTSDGINLLKLNVKSLSNITIQDNIPPIVSLISPSNNSKITGTTNPVTFTYNVTDGSEIANCTLFINNIANATNNSVIKNIPQAFSILISNNTYNWSVECLDNATNTGYSGIFNLSIIPNLPPIVANLAVFTPVDLNPGSTVRVTCNATVSDQNNRSDIQYVNSSLYLDSYTFSTPDDNNYHYSNSSCSIVSFGQESINYTCSFDVQYYASNGTWLCNINATDYSNASSNNSIPLAVNDLLAIDISPSIIDYGSIEAGKNSTTDFTLNITNLGNTDFNISVEGYARFPQDNLSLNCTLGNASVGSEKYSVNPGRVYGEMVNLTISPVLVSNLTLPHRTDDTTIKSDRNNTYWKIGLPIGIRGQCSGYVIIDTVVI